MGATVVLGYTYVSKRGEMMNSILQSLFQLKKTNGLYCSKSYAHGIECATLSSAPVSCDIVNLERFCRTLSLTKLLFYTDNSTAETILSSNQSAYQAAKLWSRKECIFKMYNKRNPFPSATIYNEDDEIIIDNKFKIITFKIDSNTIVSLMLQTSLLDIRLYELIKGDLYEKI